MIILPAIDLFGGQAVRLYQGDYNQMTVYDADPLHTVAQFEDTGATHLHLVDLEGAKTGQTTNLPTIERIAAQTGLCVEVGGGIRSMDTVRRYLEAGASRVILGTAAVTDPDFTAQAVAQYGDKIAVGADLKDGKVAIKGWLETSQNTWETFFDQMQALGVRTMICTDISRDGAMEGTNRALYRTLAQRYSMDIIASGGVSSLEDIRALQAAGVAGAIIGQASYSGAIDLALAIALQKDTVDAEKNAPEVNPDEIKMDKAPGKGQSKQVQTEQAASDAQWLQNLTTSPAKFLKQKFSLQDQVGGRP